VFFFLFALLINITLLVGHIFMVTSRARAYICTMDPLTDHSLYPSSYLITLIICVEYILEVIKFILLRFREIKHR